MRPVDLNYSFDCDRLIELSDNKMSNNKLSRDKLSDNNLANELVKNRRLLPSEKFKDSPIDRITQVRGDRDDVIRGQRGLGMTSYP